MNEQENYSSYLSSKGYQCSIVLGYSDTDTYQYDYTYIYTRYYYMG